MAKTLCIVKKNALALVGVPTRFSDETGDVEYIGFNAGRLYGRIQLSHLFANWKQGIKNLFHTQKLFCTQHCLSLMIHFSET